MSHVLSIVLRVETGNCFYMEVVCNFFLKEVLNWKKKEQLYEENGEGTRQDVAV
jgi:hypothetical protein